MPDRDFVRQLDGYRLTTAEILYHMPDHPSVLQSYIWQAQDLAPHFPMLHRFLRFWERNLDGKLHSVRFSHRPHVRVPEIRFAKGTFCLH